MKCVCKAECQIHTDEGKVRWFQKGEVWSFKECPTHFKPIEGEKKQGINFDTAGEEELREGEYTVPELKKYIKGKYPDAKVGSKNKWALVELLLDCRYRDISGQDLNSMVI